MKSNKNQGTFTSEDLIMVSRWFLHNMITSMQNAPTHVDANSPEVSE